MILCIKRTVSTPTRWKRQPSVVASFFDPRKPPVKVV
nr:MAG TPA: hypothetical protein [Caudoviricetes sp.]DAS90585.1 MAG TPA: hypothetical protein [Caudoviricetes sp.]DAT79393.1 MAG TPA: hypothetical protein [Caudoviricetes sp.]